MTLDALHAGLLGFVGHSGSGGMIIGSTTAVPEPSSLMLLGTAACGLLCRRRRKRASEKRVSSQPLRGWSLDDH